MQPEGYSVIPVYAYTDGLSETAEAAIMKLAEIGFRPDPSVAFHIMRPGLINGVTPNSFVAFAAHNSVGSTVYVYDNNNGQGVMEARENDGHGGITVTSSAAALFCYKYDESNTAAPVMKKFSATKFAPDPKDTDPARMIVTDAAD